MNQKVGIGRIKCDDGVILENRAIPSTICFEKKDCGEIDISKYASVEITNWGRYPVVFDGCITRDIKGTLSFNIDDIRKFDGVLKFQFLTDRTQRDNNVYSGNFRLEVCGIVLKTCKC